MPKTEQFSFDCPAGHSKRRASCKFLRISSKLANPSKLWNMPPKLRHCHFFNTFLGTTYFQFFQLCLSFFSAKIEYIHHNSFLAEQTNFYFLNVITRQNTRCRKAAKIQLERQFGNRGSQIVKQRTVATQSLSRKNTKFCKQLF